MVGSKGKGFGAHALVGGALLASLAVSTADAALVTLSGIITNNTSTTQTYEFTRKIKIAESITNAGIFGSMSLLVTDFNRNGAMITSTNLGELYSGWINGSEAKRFVPATGGSGGAGGFVLSAPSRSMARFDSEFGSSSSPDLLGLNLTADDEMEVRLRFTLSAGDQAAYTAAFNVVSTTAVPAPGALAVGLLAPWVSLRSRRRTENAS